MGIALIIVTLILTWLARGFRLRDASTSAGVEDDHQIGTMRYPDRW